MRYFYDTEFLEDGETIELISIGIVAEHGEVEMHYSGSCGKCGLSVGFDASTQFWPPASSQPMDGRAEQ